MRIVFSRKGYDTQYGGVPNAILPDGTPIAFPIPDPKSIVGAHEIRRGGVSVGELAEQLTGGRISHDYPAHLDPDLDFASYPREPGWTPVLGQTGPALGHLENQGISPGALFLFFAWFQPVELVGQRWSYLRGSPPAHMLWGWLHVGRLIDHTDVSEPDRRWLGYHPHLQRSPRARHVLFVAGADLEVVGRRVPGAGVFARPTGPRVLSSPGESMSCWTLPEWMHPDAHHVRFSYLHDRARWTAASGGAALVSTPGKGQEFVMSPERDAPLGPWLAELFEDVPSLP